MASLLLRAGRVVDPSQGLDLEADVLIVDGRVAAVEPSIPEQPGTPVLDAAERVVAPGFIDMHVHLREPGREDEETIATGTAAAAAGGFTGIACMPNTAPVNDNRSVTEFILERAAEVGTVPVYPIGCVSVGQQGEQLAEIGDLLEGGCVAVSDDGRPVRSALLMRRALEYTTMFGVPVIDHCEEPSLSDGAVMHEGRISTLLGLRGQPAAAEEIMVVRDLVLAELTGGHLHLAHLSTAGSLRRVREGKERGVPVTCEVTPHHFTLTEEAVREFDTHAKMNPPLRTEEDRQAVLEALADGTIDAIASDHAPHHPDEKALEFDLAPFGIVGLETAVALACDRLVHAGLIGVDRLVELFATNPARILGLEAGTLKVGVPGNVTVLDLDRARSVDVTAFRSKGRNSPFHGWELRGWPVATVVAGRVVWRDGG